MIECDEAHEPILAELCGQDRPFAEKEANARLIAAAPELLAALEMALATVERLTVQHGPFSSTQGTQAVIRAAIERATRP